METTQKKDEGILLVVSGPSGAGKGTICDAIRKLYPDLQYSVSMTTRQPRNGEVEGKSYFFRTNEQFEKLIAEDAFLEYAKVYDHYYGTPIVPPSLEILSGRLHRRGTDSEEVIEKRLAQITSELAMAHKYDYIVVNDKLEDAIHKTCSILEAEKCKLSRNEGQIETIFKQYINKEVPLK